MGRLAANRGAAVACVAAVVGALSWGVAPERADAAESPTITLSAVAQPNTSGYETDPGFAPDANGQGELFSISGLQGSYGELLAGSPNGALTPVGSSYDAQFLDSAVDADGFDWLLTTEGLMAMSAGGTVTNFQIALPGANEMTLGPNGDLYISDTGQNAIVQCTITTAPSAACGSMIPVPASFASVAPQSITSAGGSIWFTTSLGELGSLSTEGAFGGPYDEAVSTYTDGPGGPDANMLAVAPDGTLWSTADADDDAIQSQLVQFSSSTGAIIHRYGVKAGLPTDADIEGLTVGPDGNVWFIDSGGAGSIGVLNVSDGRVTQFPFPRGYAPSFLIPSGISTGPDNTVWFSAVTQDDDPAIGEINGLSSAAVSVGRTAAASGYRAAALQVSCSGPAGAGCAGRVELTAIATTHEKVGAKGATQTVAVHKTVTLGTAKYAVAAGQSATTKVTLDAEAKRLLKSAPDHRLTSVAAATPTIGSPIHFTLSIRG